MAEHSRLEDLRRRVEKDPASIAFAQLAEEYRRAGQTEDAVAVCRAGLKIHPTYLSARVTLGRALLERSELDEAQQELDRVLRSAPENLAAIRGLAEIYHQRGDLVQALKQYRAAQALAKNDPDLEQTVNDLALQVERPAALDGGHAEHVAPVVVEAVAVAEAPGENPFDATRERATRHIAALERWLEAIHVARAQRHA